MNVLDALRQEVRLNLYQHNSKGMDENWTPGYEVIAESVRDQAGRYPTWEEWTATLGASGSVPKEFVAPLCITAGKLRIYKVSLRNTKTGRIITKRNELHTDMGGLSLHWGVFLAESLPDWKVHEIHEQAKIDI